MKPIPVKKIQASPGSLPFQGRFHIRSLTEIQKGEALQEPLHKHDFFLILAITKGSGIHTIDLEKFIIRPRSVFILRPGMVHGLELEKGAAGYLLQFDPSFYQPAHLISREQWRKASAKKFCALETARFRRLHQVLEQVYLEFTRREEGYPEAIRANLDLFFIEYNRQSLHPKKKNNPVSGFAGEKLEELLALMENKIDASVSVSGYARALHLSPYQLNAITKASLGKTVSELISGQLILEAKRYLLATTKQVKEIAALLGYDDPAYFIRFFRKQTGLAPEAFRRNFS